MPKTATTTRTSHTRPARRAIPLDDEPLTPADLKAIAEADAAYARGDYCTLDELENDLKAEIGRTTKSRLCRALTEGYRRRAAEDRQLATEWDHLSAEVWARLDRDEKR